MHFWLKLYPLETIDEWLTSLNLNSWLDDQSETMNSSNRSISPLRTTEPICHRGWNKWRVTNHAYLSLILQFNRTRRVKSRLSIHKIENVKSLVSKPVTAELWPMELSETYRSWWDLRPNPKTTPASCSYGSSTVKLFPKQVKPEKVNYII